MTTTDTAPDLGDWVAGYLSDPSTADPYPMLARLRAEDPVHHSRLGPWVFTRHHDVDAQPRDSRWSRAQAAAGEFGVPAEADAELATAIRMNIAMLINRDAPDHRRLRALLQHAFTPRAIASYQRTIDRVVTSVVDSVTDEEEFDFLRRVAYPIPEMVICDMMQVPHSDHDLWGEWAAKLVARSRVDSDDEQNLEDGRYAIKSFYRYFKELIAERRENRGDDLISVMINAEEEGDRLDEDEIIGACMLLISAGHETTSNQIGNGMYLLFQHPEQRRLLEADVSLVDSAVEEILRFEPTTRFNLPRMATADIDVRGTVVPKGSLALFSYPAANRDPEVFVDPERFDITRTGNRHISFGSGVHFCLGVTLARMELRTAFHAIRERFGDLELVSTPTWNNTYVRSLSELVVRRAR